MAGIGMWESIDDLRRDALVCCRCDLCRARTHVVFGEGPVPARLMIVGEGPGAEEDMSGRPFAGRAGKFLDGMLSKAGIRREDAWVTNVVRCRPITGGGVTARNRPPTVEEIVACDIWMGEQLRFINPDILLCLGNVSAQTLISKRFRIRSGRGLWHEGKNGVMATAIYHPAFIFRLSMSARESVEAEMLADFQRVADRLNMPVGHGDET